MAWTHYKPDLTNKKPPMSAVALTIPPLGVSAAPILLIDQPTVAALHWQPGMGLAIEIGNGEHEGKIRLAPAAGEPITLQRPASDHYVRSRVRIGRMPCLSTERYRGPVTFAIEEGKPGALIVELPAQAQAHRLPAGTAAAIRRAQGR